MLREHRDYTVLEIQSYLLQRGAQQEERMAREERTGPRTIRNIDSSTCKCGIRRRGRREQCEVAQSVLVWAAG